jgi:hypothetical protein
MANGDSEGMGSEVVGILFNLAILLYGIFLEVFGIPLWVRKVGPNGCYSGTFFVRNNSLRNTQTWYTVNELAGKIMTIGGFTVCIVSLILWFIPPFQAEVGVRLAIFLVCIFGTLGAWFGAVWRVTRVSDSRSSAEAVFDSL